MQVVLERTKCLLWTSLVALIWMTAGIQQICCEPDTSAQMQKVKEKILKNYDKYVRPTNGTNTTQVHIAIVPRQIIYLDEELAIFSLDSYLYMNWLDPRLQFSKADLDDYLQLPSSLIWVPDITVHNSHSQRVNPTQDVLLAFNSTGWVWWFPPILTQTSCPITYSSSAYKIECVVAIGSWMHDGWEIDFQLFDRLILDEFENINPSWELIESEASVLRNVTVYDCCPEPYLSIHVFFPMKRRPVPAIDATRAYCVLIMLLTLSVFWLPPDSSKKVLLGGFLFFTLNVLLVFLGRNVKSPTLASSAVSFVQTTMYLVVSAIFIQVFIVIKIASWTGPSRPSPTIIQFLNGPFGKYTCLRPPSSEDKVSLELKEDESTGESATARDEWQLVAAAIDRVFFVILGIIMITVHHL